MREAVKNYGMLQGAAKRLKTWLEKEFDEEKKYNAFIDAIIDCDPKELNDWLSSLDEMVEL